MSVARAVKVKDPRPRLVHTTEYGGLVASPMRFVPKKKATLATEPSLSEAVADRTKSVPQLKIAPSAGLVRLTVGGTFAAKGLTYNVARALTTEDPERRRPLKKAGFLTRDDRKVERKKYGQAGARKRFQYSKR